jgi:amidase
LGTELEGSITWPAARAGLYAIKLSPGSVDQAGFQPGGAGFDCQGPYGKTVIDVATLSAVIQRRDPGHYLPLPTSWDGIRVGVVDPSLWRAAPDVVEKIDSFLDQTDSALYAAQTRIEEMGAKVVKDIPLATFEEIQSAMPDMEDMGELFSKSLPNTHSLVHAFNAVRQYTI